MNRVDALETEGTLSWNFPLNRKGSNNIQIISKGELPSPLPELLLECGEQVLHQAPEQLFILDRKEGKQTVSHYQSRISFREEGEQLLKIDANKAIEQIRIVPPYGRHLGFGTGKYEKE